jgi:hypothetical protein
VEHLHIQGEEVDRFKKNLARTGVVCLYTSGVRD